MKFDSKSVGFCWLLKISYISYIFQMPLWVRHGPREGAGGGDHWKSLCMRCGSASQAPGPDLGCVRQERIFLVYKGHRNLPLSQKWKSKQRRNTHSSEMNRNSWGTENVKEEGGNNTKHKWGIKYKKNTRGKEHTRKRAWERHGVRSGTCTGILSPKYNCGCSIVDGRVVNEKTWLSRCWE